MSNLPNTIKIKKNSSYGKVLSYCKKCIKLKGQEVKMEASGNAIENLINIAEDLKILIPGLHQSNSISSINKSLYYYTPLFNITLSLSPIYNKNKFGIQNPLNENERLNLKKIYKSIKTSRKGVRTRRGINRRRIINGGRVRRINGIRGRRIIRGIRGIRGMRGIRGIRGMIGIRGMRGMRGIRGMRGMRGMNEKKDDFDELGLADLF